MVIATEWPSDVGLVDIFVYPHGKMSQLSVNSTWRVGGTEYESVYNGEQGRFFAYFGFDAMADPFVFTLLTHKRNRSPFVTFPSLRNEDVDGEAIAAFGDYAIKNVIGPYLEIDPDFRTKVYRERLQTTLPQERGLLQSRKDKDVASMLEIAGGIVKIERKLDDVEEEYWTLLRALDYETIEESPFDLEQLRDGAFYDYDYYGDDE